MKNKKGFMQSWLTTYVLMIIAIIVTMSLLFSLQAKSFDKRIKLVEDYAEEMIVEIENKGYIDDKIMYDATNFIESVPFTHYVITGTREKAEPGEFVFLNIKLEMRNLLGGTIDKGKISKESVAK